MNGNLLYKDKLSIFNKILHQFSKKNTCLFDICLVYSIPKSQFIQN